MNGDPELRSHAAVRDLLAGVLVTPSDVDVVEL
jgi:hypothetical protein